MRISTLLKVSLISLIILSNSIAALSSPDNATIYSDSINKSKKNKEQKKERAFTIEAAYTGDFLYNMAGGNKQGFAYLGNVDLIVSFDTEKANLWKGGTLFAYGLNNHGTSISELVGDIQGVDNIETGAKTKLYQLWYNQKFGSWDFTIGQHDLNSEFSNTESAGHFINSSFGIQPDISANVPVSIFPFATMGFISRWKANDNFTLMLGVYAGEPQDKDQSYFLNLDITKSEGAVSIFEAQYRFNRKNRPFGTIKAGMWNHSVSSSSHATSTNYGFYLIGDFKLFYEDNNSEQGLSVFSQIGYVPKDVNLVNYYSSIGLVYQGLIPNRDSDVIGFAANNLAFNQNFDYEDQIISFKNEGILELFYKVDLGSHLMLQPDLQYVINPALSNGGDNAFLASLRFVASF